MSVTSDVSLQIAFNGDVVAQIIKSATQNSVSPGQETIQDLTTGNNTVTAPVSGGVIVTGLTIIPPAGNTIAMTLKGTASDAGILIGLVNPIYLSLASTFTDLVIACSNSVAGVRFIWS